MSRGLIFSILFFATLGSARVSYAKPDGSGKVAAKSLFETGSSFYARGQYPPAIRAFEEAWRSMPSPAIAFSLAQALRLQYFVDHDPAKLRRSIELYHGYIEKTPSGARRPDAVAMIAELEPMMHRLDGKSFGRNETAARSPLTELLISCEVEGARVSVDGGAEAEAPVAAPVTAGPHQIKVSHPDYFEVEERAVAIEGRAVGVDVALMPRPAVLGLQGDHGMAVEIEGRILAQTPLVTPIELNAGRYLLRLSRAGHVPFESTLELSRGETKVLNVELALTAQRWWAYGLMLGALGALGASGTSFALAAGDDKSALDLRAQLDGTGITEADADSYDRLKGRRDTELTLGAVTAGAGLALLTSGIALFLFE